MVILESDLNPLRLKKAKEIVVYSPSQISKVKDGVFIPTTDAANTRITQFQNLYSIGRYSTGTTTIIVPDNHKYKVVFMMVDGYDGNASPCTITFKRANGINITAVGSRAATVPGLMSSCEYILTAGDQIILTNTSAISYYDLV